MISLIKRLLAFLIYSGPQLVIRADIWEALYADLRTASDGRRESGAFLLGHITDKGREVVAYKLYHELAPDSLYAGSILFDQRHYSGLWDLCSELDLEVVADVHTHPGAEYQSAIDQAHPMISSKGHLALIIPTYAAGKATARTTGIYEYLGRKRWWAVPCHHRRRALLIRR